MNGPVSRVLAELGAGGTLRDVACRTGLPQAVVDAAVEHLVRLGRVESSELSVGCPPSGCGGCSLVRRDGTRGCGTLSSVARPGGPPLALSVRSG